ncbi:nucleoside phosphorylase domain-containing protein [Neurospora crassa]|nr:nucleoside phosphorylase domain-containing protein [Neurospora crassa]KAK3489726.1 nucleoside phosphorylase domain-containing protein [Neurospora crassa]
MATSLAAGQRQEFARLTSRYDFQIAIVCALPLEYDAISLLIDQVWDVKGDQHPFGRAPGDPNTYRNGRISNFNVVLVLLPNMGKVEAAGATASLRSSYPNLSLVLVVGICGGMPFTKEEKEEVLLGDVIISNILIQYDFGRQLADRFLVKGSIEDSLGRPTQQIRSMLRLLEVESIRDEVEDDAAQYLQMLQRKHDGHPKQRNLGKYKYPGAHKDKLFDCSYEHKHHGPSSSSDCSLCAAQGSSTCERSMRLSCDDLHCDLSRLVHRKRLVAAQMQIADQPFFPLRVFVGRMGSGDGVIRSAKHRQELAEKGVIGVEMEGAGVWDQLPCIVIKGGWQDYAAATAASVAKAVLEHCATPMVTGRDPSSYGSGSGHHAVIHGTNW